MNLSKMVVNRVFLALATFGSAIVTLKTNEGTLWGLTMTLLAFTLISTFFPTEGSGEAKEELEEVLCDKPSNTSIHVKGNGFYDEDSILTYTVNGDIIYSGRRADCSKRTLDHITIVYSWMRDASTLSKAN